MKIFTIVLHFLHSSFILKEKTHKLGLMCQLIASSHENSALRGHSRNIAKNCVSEQKNEYA
jgi:hypothetical protein